MTESPPASTDAELIPRLKAGDQSALEYFMNENRTMLMSVVRHHLKNESDVEEIVNDTFRKFFTKIHLFRGESSLKTWLVRIGKNSAFNRFHHARRRQVHLTDSMHHELAEGFTIADTLSDPDSDARDPIEIEELEENIRLAMERVSPSQREIIELLTKHHLSYEEIAAKLNINLGTVKSRVARARQAVRDSLSVITMPSSTAPSTTAAARPSSAMATKGPEIGVWLQSQNVRFVGRITVYQIEVTPRLAEAWLRLNTQNRIPSTPKIRRFATMMKSGKWLLNGETVKFADNGRLLDGQSRLMAIVKAGVSVVLEVRGGLADAAQESMDTGEARQHRHQLEMLGEKNPNEIAAALRLVYFWENGHIGGGGGTSRSGKADITNTTIREMMEKHPRIRESVGRCLNLKALLPISGAAFFHYAFAKVDEKRANLFIERLTTGANLSETSPVYLLRERLTQDRLASAKIKKREKFALIVKAWNSFYGGKELQRLTFHTDETFPEIAGSAKKETAA